MRKVNLNVIRPWIAKKIVELIGFEDEVVVEYAMGLLEDEQQPVCALPAPLSLLFLFLSRACFPDPRPQENANQLDRLFDK